MKLLVTGAAGRIGSTFVGSTKHEFEFRLTDMFPNPDTPHEFITGDIREPDFVDQLVNDVDAIVHLAGIAEPTMELVSVIETNVQPTHLLLKAAVNHKVTKFIFASSAQTIEGYPLDTQVSANMPVSPANFYGVGKCYGEALCAFYAQEYGLSTVSLRIGAFEFPEDPNLNTLRDFSAWLSPDDCVHLIECALLADTSGHFIANGISNNRFKRLDLSQTREKLGYHPKDDAFVRFQLPSL